MEKDDRGTDRYEATQKLHHRDYKCFGADVISKKSDSEANSSSDDPFGVKDTGVQYSLHKGGRWKAVDQARDIINESEPGTTFVSASIPRNEYGGTITSLVVLGADVDRFSRPVPGAKLYLEKKSDGEDMVERQGKGMNTSFKTIVNESHPGPYSRRERRMIKEKKKRGEIEEKTAEVVRPTTRYTVLTLRDCNPGYCESQWRIRQRHTGSDRGAWGVRRPRFNFKEHVDDYYDDEVDDDDDYYEKEDDVAEESTDAPPRRDLPLEERREPTPNNFDLRKDIPSLATEDMFKRARDYIKDDTPKHYLDVLPAVVVVHEADSLRVFGQALDHCTYVQQKENGYAFYAAPNLCCGPRLKVLDRNGWKTIFRREHITLHPSPPDEHLLTGCLICTTTAHAKRPSSFDTSFAMRCGHSGCASAWVDHVKIYLTDPPAAYVPCPNKRCDRQLSLSAASFLLDDRSLKVYNDYRWNKLSSKEGMVKCATCPCLLQKSSSSPLLDVMAYCSECELMTCTKCGLYNHLPLQCDDFKEYLKLLGDNFLESAVISRNSALHLMDLQLVTYNKTCEACKEGNIVSCKLNGNEFCTKCGDGLSVKHSRLFSQSSQLVKCLHERLVIGEDKELSEWEDIMENEEEKKETEKMEKARFQAAWLVELSTARREANLERVIGENRKTLQKNDRSQLNIVEDEVIDCLHKDYASTKETTDNLLRIVNKVYSIYFMYFM